MDTSTFNRMIGRVLTLALVLGLSIDAKSQQVEVAELDKQITQLTEEEGEELRSLYYDSNASVFYRSDKSEPIQVGKGRTKVIHVDATRLPVLSNVDGPFVSMVVINFASVGANGSYSISAHDLANFPLLKFVVFVANGDAVAERLARSSVKDLTGDESYSILYKSVIQAN
ncbi:hypothetical protein ACFOET_01155 [Parapedobacter deserti]|uniref:Uncharacterized protein n=1 Tax=Parapedobacter deserti TaxID=1912957 RepID=A0ABV7JH72_9SPHI